MSFDLGRTAYMCSENFQKWSHDDSSSLSFRKLDLLQNDIQNPYFSGENQHDINTSKIDFLV